MKNVIIGLMSVVILGVCLVGFGGKFIELVHIVTSDDQAAREGIYAVTPIVNYLLASAGFLCLLGWAASHGMFRDVEGPKQTMLDDDARLDAASDDQHYPDSILFKPTAAS